MKDSVQSTWARKDGKLEKRLRPNSLSEFIGQKQVIERLEVFVGAAKGRNEHLGHALFYGPPGLGKTSLGAIIANEMGTNLVTTSGPNIEKAGDLAGLLTNLNEGDVLFIDEIHRLNKTIEEYLYPAMEDFSLDIMLDSGPQARSVQIDLKPFTLVGATTQIGLLTGPLRSRFQLTTRLDFYPQDEIAEIISRSSDILGITCDDDAIIEIAKRARGTPRIANNLLRWVRDYTQMRTQSRADKVSTRAALDMLAIDHRGLDELDKKLLHTLIDHHEGGPVGINALAAALGEDATTLSEVSEPFLIMQGLLRRTQKGREATTLAYSHLGKQAPKDVTGDN